jgi:hypothetical protein
MITDPVQVEESLWQVIDYNWKDERDNFEETYETEIDWDDDIDKWIKFCQEKGWTNHIFYHLMILKSAYSK